MIGHERRRGHSALRPPLAAIYCRANDAESARSLWIERSGGTNWALRRPGANPGTCPVARIGRASPSAHPVGRQPIRGPVPARTRTPVRRGLPGRGGGRPGTRDGPSLSALSSRPPLERPARGGRPPASPPRPRTPRHPPPQRRAGLALLPPPPGAHAAPPHGSAVPASPSAAAPPVSPPNVAAAAVGRPSVDAVTCRTACLGLSSATPGSIVRVTGDGAEGAASVVFLGRHGRGDDVVAAAHPLGPAAAETLVPAGAHGGPVRLVTVDGRRSARSARRIAVRSGGRPARAFEARVAARKAFVDASRRATLDV